MESTRNGAKKLTGSVNGFRKDFIKFINKGNVIDLAVGLVVGTAFGNIVKSLTDDIIGPVLGLAVGKYYILLSTSSF
jgi:large conductance mechanosensitive channel